MLTDNQNISRFLKPQVQAQGEMTQRIDENIDETLPCLYLQVNNQ